MPTPSASTNGRFYRLSDVPREDVTPQLSRRLISGERLNHRYSFTVTTNANAPRPPIAAAT